MSHTATISSGQEPPLKKPEKEPTSNLPLPHDLILNCIARVSRFHYPILSLVSKSFRSLISSPELYQTRSLLHRTENCLYVCLQFPTEPNPRWFTLCRKPDKPLSNHISKKKKKTMESSSGNFFAPIQILNSPPVKWSNLVSVGHKLYAISSKDAPCSSNVFFLDCRTHMWLDTPRLRLAHTDSRLDGMMYLAGSFEDPDSLDCVEVFNTKTQTWKPVPPEKRILTIRDFEGKIMHLVAESGIMFVAIKPKDSTVDAVGFGGICRIENTIYVYKSNGEFLWYKYNSDIGDDVLKKVKGLEGLPKFARYCSVKLVACGGKMMVFWDKYVPACGGYKEKKIWCAEISLEKRSSEEIWGHVEWFDSVLTVPKFYKFVYAIAATV